jgi:hypothetical protein
VPPLPNQKVKVFTQEAHAAQRGEGHSMNASKEENDAYGRHRHWPERDKAFTMALNPMHDKGYCLSTTQAAAM